MADDEQAPWARPEQQPQPAEQAPWAKPETAPDNLQNAIKDNMAHNWTSADAKVAQNPVEMLAAGFDMSSSSLAFRGAPKTVTPENAGLLGKVAFGLGEMAGDLPATTAGLVGGAAVGAGATAETGPGAAVGAAVGGGAGAAGLPEALRQVLMDHYEHEADKTLDFETAMARASKIVWETGKAAAVGALGAGVAGKAGAAALDATGSTSASALASAGAYATTATAAGGALNGQVPDSGDFVSALVLMGGFHVAGMGVSLLKGSQPTPEGERVMENMRDIYSKTGVPPWEQAQRAQRDPNFRQEVFGRNSMNDPVTQNFGRDKPPEPEPYKPAQAPAQESNLEFIKDMGEPSSFVYTSGKARIVGDELRNGTLRISNAHVDEPGLGYGTEAYADLASRALAQGRELHSDVEVSAPAARVYEKLGEIGFTVEKNPAARLEEEKWVSDKGPVFKITGAPSSFQTSDELSPLIQRLERSGDAAVSPKGAIGRFQILPDTARQYGFDPARLADPAYNEQVAKAILGDLTKRFRNPDGSVDVESVLIAYNAGPGRAVAFRAGGRDFNRLPNETQQYLLHAERLTGGTGMGGKGPPLPPALPPSGEGAPEPEDPFKLSTEMLTSKINDIVANPVKPSLLDRTRDWFRNANFQVISELAPAERLDRALGTPESELGVTGMFRQVYGSAGRAWLMLHDGTLDPVNPENPNEIVRTGGPALMDAYKSANAKDGSVEQFKAYRQALRTLELAKTGRESQIDINTAKALVEKVGRKYDDEIEIARMANDAKIDYYRYSGMLSAEQAQAIKDNNRDWFPQIPEKEAVAAARKGNRFGPTQVIRAALGHERKILDPAAQELKSYYTMAAVADKNRAVAGMMAALKKTDMEALGIKLLEDKTTKIELFDKDGNLIPEALTEPGPIEGQANTVSWFENGTRYSAHVDDPQLAQMVRGIAPLGQDVTADALRWFASLKRSGIVEMPDFIARTITRHSFYAAVLSKYGGAPFANTFRGLFHVMKQDDVFKEAMANGVFASNLTDIDANYVMRDLHAMQTKAGFFNGVVNVVKHPLEAVQIIQQRLASAPRLGVYLKAKEAGLAPLRAGVEGRTSGLDYAEKGASPVLNILSGMVPFYRASILDVKQMAAAFMDRPLTTSLKAMAYITLPTAALYAINTLQDKDLPDDRKFANLPRWQKDTMFILPEIDGVRLRLPMPWTLGTVFGGMTNRLLDSWAQNDPDTFKAWAPTILAKALPPIIPAAALPVWEHFANYNTFTGRPLIPAALEKDSNYMQYTPATTTTAKELARWLGPPHMNAVDVSPIVVDNYVHEWTGGLGMAIMRTLGAPFDTSNVPPDPANNPFIGSFIARNPGLSAQPVEDFYDKLDEIQKKHGDLKAAFTGGDEELQQLGEQNVQSFLNLKQYQDALSYQKSAVNAITNDKMMTPDEKRERIDQIYSGMIQTAKAGLMIARSVK